MADPLLAYSFRKGVFFFMFGWLVYSLLSVSREHEILDPYFVLSWGVVILAFGQSLESERDFVPFQVFYGIAWCVSSISFVFFWYFLIAHSFETSDCCSDAVLWISRTITFLSPLFFLLIDIILSTKEICIAFQLFPQFRFFRPLFSILMSWLIFFAEEAFNSPFTTHFSLNVAPFLTITMISSTLSALGLYIFLNQVSPRHVLERSSSRERLLPSEKELVTEGKEDMMGLSSSEPISTATVYSSGGFGTIEYHDEKMPRSALISSTSSSPKYTSTKTNSSSPTTHDNPSSQQHLPKHPSTPSNYYPIPSASPPPSSSPSIQSPLLTAPVSPSFSRSHSHPIPSPSAVSPFPMVIVSSSSSSTLNDPPELTLHQSNPNLQSEVKALLRKKRGRSSTLTETFDNMLSGSELEPRLENSFGTPGRSSSSTDEFPPLIFESKLEETYLPIPPQHTDRYSTFIEELRDSQSKLVFDVYTLIFNQTPTEDPEVIARHEQLMNSLIVVFEADHKSPLLLQSFVEYELLSCEMKAMLFREESLSGRLFQKYNRYVSSDYIELVLFSSIQSVLSEPKLDPTLDEGERLTRKTKHLVRSIIATQIPAPIQSTCAYLASRVTSLFPEESTSLVPQCLASFMFLHLYCPAVVFPERFGLVGLNISDEARGKLVLLSKSLFYLALGIDSSCPEAELAVFDSLSQDLGEEFQEFLGRLSSVQSGAPPQNRTISQFELQTEIDFLRPFQYLYNQPKEFDG